MSSEDDSSKVVYVGHLPYDMTEEQIKDVFKTAGPVKQIRLVFDRLTGKSKGFAFVQYYKPESAQSAVRNLDKYKVGNMQLKVNYSSGKFFDKKPQGGKANGDGSQGSNDEISGIVPEIVDFVSTVPPQQKQQILSELKQFIVEKPDVAKLVLEQNPQVTYAIVQTMFELGLIDGAVAQSLIVDQPATPQPDEQQFAQAPQLEPPPQLQQPPPSPRMRSPTPQSSNGPSQVQGRLKRGRPANAPPQAALQTTPQAPPQAPQAPQTQMSEEQKNIYRQIMSLTPEQLGAMPVEQQQAAMHIRAQITSGIITL